MKGIICRRKFLVGASGSFLASQVAIPLHARSVHRPVLPVSIARCEVYDPTIIFSQLRRMANFLGGLRRLVAGKTVAVKLNLTGDANTGMLGLPPGQTYQVHQSVVVATAALLDSAGARKIRFVEGTYQNTRSLAQYLIDAHWDLSPLSQLRAVVEFEDTRNLGYGRNYVAVKVPQGGSLFPVYYLNHSYVDCDFYVSLAKLKNHITAGVTLGMKNNFGITPTSLYTHHEPDESSVSNRSAIIHTGEEAPPAGLPAELDPLAPRLSSLRVPRCIVDTVGIRPIDLTIIDGIETVSGGEGPWCDGTAPQTPNVLIMGRNPVCTDTVATAVMGYNPAAAPGTGPFPGDNHLALAAARGLGTNNLREIPILGLPLRRARYPFLWEPSQRFT